jgi:O-antigen/teichoic acid export membrane protein
MGVIKRQGILNTIVSYAGILLGYVNTVLLFPNFLEEDQIGLTRLLIFIAVMYAQFSALGFGNMGLRFFPYYRDKARQHHGFLFLLLSIPLAGFAVVTALFVFARPHVLAHYAEKSTLLGEYYYYLIPLGLFTLLFVLLDAYLRSLYKTVVSAFLQEFFLRLLITLTITAYALELFDFQTFVLLFVGANCLSSLILIGYLLWLRQFFAWPRPQTFRRKPFSEMLQYGFYSFMGNISGSIISTTDSLMILSFLSLSEVGIYTTAFYVTTAILVPARSLYRVAYAQVVDYWKENDLPALDALYKRISLLNMIVSGLLFIGIWANRHNIFALMPETFSAGTYVLLFIGLARLVDVAVGINAIIMVTSRKYRYDLVFNIILVVLIIWTNYLFIPRYGISGAAFASLLAYALSNLLRLGFLWKVFGLQPFTSRSLLVLGIGALTLAVDYLIPYLGHTLPDILVRSAVITAVYGVLVLILRVSADVNQTVGNVVAFLLRKGKGNTP